MSQPTAAELQHQIIPMLQEIQEQLGYIPKEAVDWLSNQLRVSSQEIFGVATFYNHFRLNPPGRHEIRVCLGTACHVGGGEKLLDTIREKLGIESGKTTDDGQYSLERVACVGACARSPAVVLDDEVHGRMTQRSLKRLLDKVEREDKKQSKMME
ncbi:MAG: NADH-quinone oxidoreductase subunit NuoE [Candidatus Thorarchaeota archaeon]|nr:MAG: NADH-quinone oxidoreductase subunit NuoE [Candidatus Thorarchaeota archaeon]